MTFSDYLDLARFPLTTQRGLSPKNQLLIDTVNFDLLREFLEEGGLPTESQRRRREEFREKMKHHVVLTEELTRKEAKQRRG